MEQKQVNLLLKVLKILEEQGLLKDLIVAGSWCLYFYKFFFHKKRPIATLRTRDIDFIVPEPKDLKAEIDLPELLKSLGFIIDFQGSAGFVRLVHPEFFIEFLVPERGRAYNKAYPLPSLKVNAQALRFLDVLYIKTISVDFKGVKLRLPHPACFLLHKIIIYKRRPRRDKRLKEIEQIERLSTFLEKQDNFRSVKRNFAKLHPKWQTRVLSNLRDLRQDKLLQSLQ
jgi:hypothetical protein